MEGNALEDLIMGAQSGNSDALDELLRVLQPQIYRFSRQMCRVAEDAEDVTQDAMIAIIRSITQFRGDSSISTWLYTITRNIVYKKFRTAKRDSELSTGLKEHESTVTETPGATNQTPLDNIQNRTTIKQVERAISDLEDGYRDVLVLRDVEGLSTKEVAEIVGLSEAAVKSRLHRARGQLREFYEKQPYIVRKGCPDIRRVFSEHLEGDLSQNICDKMQAHVNECSRCAQECDELKSAIHTCSTLAYTVPQEVTRRIRYILLSEKNEA